jgi:hypothetical protein
MGEKLIKMKSRVTQDRRHISRIGTRFECHFTHEGARHNAVVIDLSLNGAFLSAKVLPQIGDLVTLSLKLPTSKNTMEVQGKVIRGTWGNSDHGKLGRFGIRFSHTPLDIVKFISQPKA